LKDVGDISKPVRTIYGWHIIKLLERKNLEPFEVLEPIIRNKISRDSRSELSKAYFIERIKKENNFTEVLKSKEWALAKADTNLPKAKWSYDEKEPMVEQPLFYISKKTYKILDFFSYVKAYQRPRTDKSPKFLMEEAYKNFVEKTLLEYEEANLENRYPDFKLLMKEYRDGILLFNLMDEKVWTKAIQDTSGLKNFFNQNRIKYQWGERAVATVYNCANNQILEKLKPYLNQNLYPLNDPKPTAFNFDLNKVTISEQGKSVLDGIFNTLVRDKNAYAEIALSHVKGENKGIPSLRKNAIKNYLIEKNADTNRIVLLENGFILKKSPATVGVKYLSSSKKSMEKLFNEENPLNLQIFDGKFQKGDNEYVDKVWGKIGEYLLNINDRKILVVISNIEPPRLKNFEECRGNVISDYQNHLEQEWINELKTKYKYQINYEILNSMIKK
jgi:peptidyl-prolyl cis-trans isomerase SurA